MYINIRGFSVLDSDKVCKDHADIIYTNKNTVAINKISVYLFVIYNISANL